MEAIRQRRVPSFNTDSEKIIYEFATQLHRDHRVNDETLRCGQRVWGGRYRRLGRYIRVLYSDINDFKRV